MGRQRRFPARPLTPTTSKPASRPPPLSEKSARPSLPIPHDAAMGRARRSPAAMDRAGPAPAVPRLQPTALGERWNEVVAALIEGGRISALVRELAWQAQCVAMADASADAPAVWRLRVEREMLRAPGHVERLQAALAAHLERPLTLETEGGATSDTPALRATAERDRRQAAAEALITQDPVVVSLLSQFKSARIVPGSIQPC